MPPFDNSIYFPYEARRGSSRLYFSPEKSTLRMASTIFSSPADKDCILCSLFFEKDHRDFFFCQEKFHFERRASATRKFQTRTTHFVENKSYTLMDGKICGCLLRLICANSVPTYLLKAQHKSRSPAIM